jgi:amino acid adenylation domain-containing protein
MKENKHLNNIILSSQLLEENKAYWMNKLSNVVNKRFLYGRKNYDSVRYVSKKFRLPADLSSDILKLSNGLEYATYMILLSAVNYLLYEYTGELDIIIGSHCLRQKNNQYIQNHSLPLRTVIQTDMSYKDYLTELKSTVVEGNRHQSFSFEKLNESLGIKGDESIFYETAVSLKNIHEEGFEKELLGDLSFVFNLDKNVLECELNYNKLLYDESLIDNYIGYLIEFLRLVTENTAIKLSDIHLLSQSEMDRIVLGFNKTQISYPKDKTVKELFEEQVLRTPDKTALVYEKESVTYKELNSRANRLAHTLLHKKQKNCEVVALIMEPSIELVIGMLAIIKAGMTYLPIDSNFPAERMEYMMRDCGVRLAICQAKFSDKIMLDIERILLEDSTCLKDVRTNPTIINDSQSILYIIYTSGTTGQPKGTMIKHRGLVNYINWFAHKINITSDDKTVLLSSFAFDLGYTTIYSSLLHGCELHLMSKDAYMNISSLLHYIAKNQITYIKLTPSFFNIIVNAQTFLDPGICQSLKTIVLGGESLVLDDVKKYHDLYEKAAIMNHYGPTETTVGAVSCFIRFDELEKNNPYPCIGRPIYNTQIYILDKEENLLPIGAIGEICISGEGVGAGYLNRAELNEERFVEKMIRSELKTLYKTGDLGKFDKDGAVYFIGRKDNQVKVAGYRIELGEIESSLHNCDSIREAVVLLKEEADRNKLIYAYIVESKRIATDEIRAFLRNSLPEYMIPNQIIKLEHMPLTFNGKINRAKLADMEVKLQNEVDYKAPENELQKKILRIWSEVLNKERIGIKDNFFHLGGNSMKAIKLLYLIQKEINMEIPLRELFRFPTVESISKLIEDMHSNMDYMESDQIVLLKRGVRDGKNVFLVHDGFGEINGYLQLIELLNERHSYWGIRAKDIEGLAPKARNIKHLAKEYLGMIKTIQNTGSYSLIGWSLGGSICFEIVRQLEEQNEPIDAFVMIDSHIAAESLDVNFTLVQEYNLINRYICDDTLNAQINGAANIEEFWERVYKFLNNNENIASELIRKIGHQDKEWIDTGEKVDLIKQIKKYNLIRSLNKGMQLYKPCKINSDIEYFRAMESDRNNTLQWKSLCNGMLNVTAVSGDHYSIMKEPFVKQLAEVINGMEDKYEGWG